MKEYKTEQIRNVALISHNGAGKTTFVERLLFNTDVTTRMGSVQSGTAAMDFEEEEIARNSSVATAVAPIEWQNLKFNILDTPGYADFIGDSFVLRGCRRPSDRIRRPPRSAAR
jgi:elongation factor G